MDGIDIPAFLETYGLPGLFIVLEGFVIRAIWTQLMDQINGRLDDQRRQSEQLAAVTKTMENTIDAVRGKNNG
jgi:hypothetical protein